MIYRSVNTRDMRGDTLTFKWMAISQISMSEERAEEVSKSRSKCCAVADLGGEHWGQYSSLPFCFAAILFSTRSVDN